MPTDLERTGDFSQSLTSIGTLRTIYDPITTVLNVATNTASRMPFPSNIIPGNRIDPTAKRIMQDFWGPNNPGDDLSGSNNFKASYPWPMKDANFSNKTDWNISDKLKVFGTIFAVPHHSGPGQLHAQQFPGDAERQRRHYELAKHRRRPGLHDVGARRF